jgi:N-acetyl-gamma-glutamyl-phosphate reductase
MTMDRISLGLVGARGYVGQELVKLLARHPRLSLAFVSSRTLAGAPVASHLAGAPAGMVFEDLDPEAVAARSADVVVLALPNGEGAPYVAALERARPEAILLDVSADRRLDDAWVYGLPEIFRDKIRTAKRIANPGCYATAAALALRPIAALLTAPAQAFGVSGYSGAGVTPSPRNDVNLLRDNLMPYSLIGHAHEAEITRYAGPVRLLPHVAPFFRGISVTISLSFREPISTAMFKAIYARNYAHEPLLRITDAIPLVRDAANQPHATLGGFAVDVERQQGVVVATLDNLLKGAASQAVQNLNLAFGLPELMGIEPWRS